MSRTGRGSVDCPGAEVTNETNMAELQNSTRVQAPNIQRLKLFSAPAHLQRARRTKSTKSTTASRANDELPIKLMRGISDSVEKKVNIFRPKVTLSVGTNHHIRLRCKVTSSRAGAIQLRYSWYS